MINESTIGHFTCLKSYGGIPLFSRNVPESKTIPFQIIGTLNSIFTISDNYGFRLSSFDSVEFKIVWKMYHSNITLILIEEAARAIDDRAYLKKLDLLFDALVLMYGLDDLINISNVEKFKKEIKVAYPLVDSILQGEHFDLFGGYLTDCFDLILLNDLGKYQSLIDLSCKSIVTSYSCLLLNGKIITASNAWWEFAPVESYLISLLCLTLDSPTSRDIPIYLPYKSPHTPLRLLTYNLVSNNVTIVFICSEKPSVDSVEIMIRQLWHPFFQSVVALKQLFPRNLPLSISLDQNMIAFLLVNKRTKCCTSSLYPNEKTNFNLKIDELKARYDLLKVCYLNINTNFFERKKTVKTDQANPTGDADDELTSCTEAYTIMNEFKCYALNEKVFEFYALYNKTIPTYAMRGVTKVCYNILINFS